MREAKQLVWANAPHSRVIRAISVPDVLVTSPPDGRDFHVIRWKTMIAAGDVIRVEIEAVITLSAEDADSGN